MGNFMSGGNLVSYPVVLLEGFKGEHLQDKRLGTLKLHVGHLHYSHLISFTSYFLHSFNTFFSTF